MATEVRAVTVPASWGYDTIAVFDAARAALLKAAAFPGQPVTFLWRYASDMSLSERDAILGAGWVLLLVSHVQRPGWHTGGASGGSDAGTRDVFHARRLGYPRGAHIGIDMEGLGDQGPSVVEYVRARCGVIIAAGFLVACYEGYDDGLSPALRDALSDVVDVWWSDYGPRTAPGAGFVAKQHAQTTVAHVVVDPDQCFGTDARGRQLVGMALVDVEDAEEDVETAAVST